MSQDNQPAPAAGSSTQTKGSTTREAKRQQQETERQQQMLNDSDKRPRIDDEKLSKSWRMLPC
ncbi:hypothetical protein PGTUg99_010611 [Puccinia graminis f. sp. tritici]|uniref:Uncharacterized protein n=1 Tax=Puccinia graminis f. sp. tritici TaxID=56615 RepID=A0A5B0M9X6_PUCGR|nr:hypothetical protein PGTUg99_010611 [Puccinia graminis f. sp. tritici]